MSSPKELSATCPGHMELKMHEDGQNLANCPMSRRPVF